MHAIWIVDNNVQENLTQWIIPITMYWIMRRWSESKLKYRNSPISIPDCNVHLNCFMLTEDTQAQLQVFINQYTLQCISKVWYIYEWNLFRVTPVLGEIGDWTDLSWSIKQSMANGYISILIDYHISGREISADACPWTRGAFQISPKLNIK